MIESDVLFCLRRLKYQNFLLLTKIKKKRFKQIADKNKFGNTTKSRSDLF